MNIIDGAGFFIYPLGICSFLALFVLFERYLALRQKRVIPAPIEQGMVYGDLPKANPKDPSIANRILKFFQETNPDAETLKAYTKLQASRMERGIFILDIVVAAAPLLGLLGTVVGLIEVFAHISPETGVPDPTVFIKGIALALTTTMLGLMIAIPALVGNSYLCRRIEVLSTKLEVLFERLIQNTK